MMKALCHSRHSAGISSFYKGRCPTKSGMTIITSILVIKNY